MATVKIKNTNDSTHLGDCAATQPLSGKTSVMESIVVNGLGRGGFVREKAEKTAAAV